MKQNNDLTLNNVLVLLVVYCMFRFSLVMTADVSLFSLSLVVLVGIGTIFIYAYLDSQYAGRILRPNTIPLVANILCVVIIREMTERVDYVSSAGTYTKQLIVLFILWGFFQYLLMQNTRIKKRVVSLYLMAVAISAAYTLYVALNGHANIIRNTAFGEIDRSFPFLYGGFDFIYGLTLVYAVLFTILRYGKARIKPIVNVYIVLLLILIAATIIASGYSTAFALILIFTVFHTAQKAGTRAFWLLILIVFVYAKPEILTKTIESIPFMPEITSTRINELLLSFSGKGSSAYITEEGQRLDRVFWSLKVFAAHPLLGLFGSNGVEKLGYHTEWIDQLARYGIITAFFNAMFWLGTYRIMLRDTINTPLTQKCIKYAFLLYFVLGFLNPISMVITAAPLFLLCPFSGIFFRDNGNREVNL